MHLEFYIECQFHMCESNKLFFFFLIYFGKSLSYILSPGGFVESSFTFLDLAGLDHHFTAFGGTRKPGTDLLVIR